MNSEARAETHVVPSLRESNKVLDFGRLAPAVTHVQVAAWTALVAGALDGALTRIEGAEMQPLVSAIAGAGLAAWFGALFGLAQGAIGVLLARAARRFSLKQRWSDSWNVPGQSRCVQKYTWVSALVLATVISGLSFAWLLGESERIKEPQLQTIVLVLGAVGAAWLLLLLRGVLSYPLGAGFARLERRVGLPFPRPLWLRYLLFVFVPAFALALPMYAVFGPKLGILSRVLGLVLFFIAQGALFLVGRAVAGRVKRPKIARGLRASSFVLLVAALAGSAVLLQVSPRLAQEAALKPVVSLALTTVQRLSDADGDGVSSLFGGRDCAPFDAERSPAERDIPNNRVDEDCDGEDLVVTDGAPPLAVFSAKLRPEQVKDYNVLWLIVDSLRTDHLPLYGYATNNSPALSALGKEAIVFERAYAQSSNTSLSVPSMFSGRIPGSLQWRKGGYPVAQPGAPYLAETLSEAGYATTLVTNDWVKKRLPGIAHGFERRVAAPSRVNWRSGRYVLSNVIVAMEEARSKQQPFFVAAHVDDVHHPYISWKNTAVPSFTNGETELEHYDRGISVFDQQLQVLVDHLKSTKLWHNTIFIVTADHGEEFGEHGGSIHSQSCYEEVVRVPLLMRIPGFKPRRVAERVSLTDLVPTVIELTGKEEHTSEFDGQSVLVPLLAPGLVDENRPVYCSIFQLLSGRRNFFVRSVRTDGWTLTHDLISDRVELFDTTSDPAEQKDLSRQKEHEERIEQMKQLLKQTLSGNLFAVRSFQ